MLRPFLLTLALALPTLASAQSVAFGGMRADTKAPVELSADQLSVNQSTGKATFTGNVVIGQGEMRLGAQSVEVTYAGGPAGDAIAGQARKIESLHATGGVTLANGPDAAEAKDAVYDVASGNITLTGDVVLTQGQNVMSGEKMLVNLASGTAQVSGRVRTVLQPGGN